MVSAVNVNVGPQVRGDPPRLDSPPEDPYKLDLAQKRVIYSYTEVRWRALGGPSGCPSFGCGAFHLQHKFESQYELYGLFKCSTVRSPLQI